MAEREEIIILDEYTMPKGRMLVVVALHYLKTPLLLMAMLFVASLVSGILFDYRWVVLSLMLLLVIFPMLLLWLYIRYCLTRDIAMNVVRHIFEISPKKIICRWYPSMLSSEKKEKAEHEEDGKEAIVRVEEIDCQRIESIDLGLKSMTVWLADCGYGKGFLYIPYDIIPEGKSNRVVEMLMQYNK